MQPVICTICEREIAPEDIIEFDEQTLCPHCASANTIICTCCGERIWNDSNSGDSDTPLCERSVSFKVECLDTVTPSSAEQKQRPTERIQMEL